MWPVPQDRYSVGWTVSDQDEWRSGECGLYLRTGTVSGGQSVTRTNGVQVNAACTSGQVQCRVDSQ